MITAEDITDEQLHELEDWLNESLTACGCALRARAGSARSLTPEFVSLSLARCALLLNAMLVEQSTKEVQP